MTLEVNVFHVEKQPHEEDDECYHTDVIDTLVMEEIDKSYKFDPLSHIFRDVESENLFYPDNINVSADFKIQDKQKKFFQPCFENLPPERDKPKSSAVKTWRDNSAPQSEGPIHVFDNG